MIAATLGIEDLSQITETERDQIRDVHLLLAMFNALQPGVFALSGWDLAGMLTVDAADVADLIADGDTRWINRGAHDLRGVDDPAREGRMPARAQPLRHAAGPARRPGLVRLAPAPDHRRARPEHEIATAVQIDIPQVSHRSELVIVHRLARRDAPADRPELLGREISGSVRSEHLPAGATVTDMFTDEEVAHRRRPAQLHRRARAPTRATSLLVRETR